MIQANELRIGNYARRSTALPAFKITAKDIVELEDGWRILHPIPLTPEILEKCGWIHNPVGIYQLSFERPMTGFASEFRIWWYRDDICIEPMGKDTGHIGIEYLHQLQNLYFALTGEELTVNF